MLPGFCQTFWPSESNENCNIRELVKYGDWRYLFSSEIVALFSDWVEILMKNHSWCKVKLEAWLPTSLRKSSSNLACEPQLISVLTATWTSRSPTFFLIHTGWGDLNPVRPGGCFHNESHWVMVQKQGFITESHVGMV